MLTVSERSPGTPEHVWMAWPGLRDAPSLDVGAPVRLVVVAPHPDDEVLGAAGLMRRTAEQGGTVEIVAVTDGEASHPGVERDVLRARRRDERAAALRCLGLDPVIHHLGLPDGRVAESEALLEARLLTILEPAAICVSSWRHDGHPDHEVTARAAIAACRRAGSRLVEYPVWAWHWATPDHGLPTASLRRLDLPVADRLAKADAIGRFVSQVRPLAEAPDVGVVLPDAVLERFRRSFETYVVGEDRP